MLDELIQFFRKFPKCVTIVHFLGLGLDTMGKKPRILSYYWYSASILNEAHSPNTRGQPSNIWKVIITCCNNMQVTAVVSYILDFILTFNG